MKYFNFDQLNEKVNNWISVSGNPDTDGRYFDFRKLNDLAEWYQELALFFIISWLIYLWIKLFLAYDKT